VSDLVLGLILGLGVGRGGICMLEVTCGSRATYSEAGQGNQNRYLFILHRRIILLASSLLLTGGPNRQSGCFAMRGYILLVGTPGCCSSSSFLLSHMISASLKSSVRTDRTRWEVLTLRLNFRRGLRGVEENISLLKYICIWLGRSGHMHDPVTFILPDLYHK
jgi:hypothetical protein